MYQKTTRNAAWILVTLTFAFLTTVHAALASTGNVDTACANAVPVDLDTVHRGYGDGGYENGIETPHVVRLDVASTGILAVDLTPSNPTLAEARLSLFRCGEGRGSEGDTILIEKAADRLVLAVQNPGTFYFRLGARDPGRDLREYKLTNRFLAATLVEDEITPDPKLAAMTGLDGITVVRTHFHTTAGSPEKVGEEPTDPGEDGLRTAPGRLLVSVASLRSEQSKSEKVGEEPTDPGEDGFVFDSPAGSGRWVLMPGSGDERTFPWTQTVLLRRILWPDLQEHPAQVRSVEALEVSSGTDRLCRRDELDDHGDTLRCSTPIALNRAVAGEIANDWGDDHDTFSFTLSELGTVRIEVSGEVEVDVTIYDRFGQRLRRQDGGLATILGPGGYFVRLAASSHAEGAYQLELELPE